MLYILEKDFFSSTLSFESVAYEIDEVITTERAVLNFDPFVCNKFLSLLDSEEDKRKQVAELALNYYSDLEAFDKYSLEWYELDSNSLFYIDSLGELMVNLNWEKYHLSACGVVPIMYPKIDCFLYYHISPYEDLADRFNVISMSEYKKILTKHKIGAIK